MPGRQMALIIVCGFVAGLLTGVAAGQKIPSGR